MPESAVAARAAPTNFAVRSFEYTLRFLSGLSDVTVVWPSASLKLETTDVSRASSSTDPGLFDAATRFARCCAAPESCVGSIFP